MTLVAELAPAVVSNQLPAEPPSERDWDVWEAVSRDGLTQRQAAERFSLSQPRVCKILREVESWGQDNETDPRAGRSSAERRRLAEHTYRFQLGAHYREAIQAWEASKGMQEESRPAPGGCGAPAVRRYQGFGKPVYLMLAVRIAERIARLDGVDTTGKTVRQELAKNRLSEQPGLAAQLPPTAVAQGPAAQAVTDTIAHIAQPAAERVPPKGKVIKREQRPATPEERRALDEIQQEFERVLAEYQRSPA